MAVKKYVKAPTSTTNLLRYTDEELKKLENVISAQSELINYFEEELELATQIGEFSPILAGGTTAGVGTYTLQHGRYWKRDRLVVVQFRAITTAHTGTGQIRLINLPFPVVDNGINGFYSCNVWSQFQAVEVALATASRLDFYGPNPAGALNIVNAMDLLGSITYISQS